MSKVKSDHPIAGRRRKGSTAKQEEVTQPADLQGATAKMKELMSADAEGKKTLKEFEPAELKDLKDLVFLGRKSEEIEIAGYVFKISTLTNAEKRRVIKDLAGRGKEMASFVKACTLAMAIQSINDLPLEDLYEGDDAEELTPYERALCVVDEWQSALVDRLFFEYEKINEVADGVFSADEEGEDKLKK